MSGPSWLSFGFVVPMLAALLLVIAVSCGGGATSTAAPQPEAAAPAAEPVAEAVAPEPEAPQAHLAPTATPVPVAQAEATAVPEVVTTGAEPYGTLNVGESFLGYYSGHTRYGVSGELNYTAAVNEGLFRVNFDSQFEGLMVDHWSLSPITGCGPSTLRRGSNSTKAGER